MGRILHPAGLRLPPPPFPATGIGVEGLLSCLPARRSGSRQFEQTANVVADVCPEELVHALLAKICAAEHLLPRDLGVGVYDGV